ncbi:MAG: hypothetical protein ACXAEX_20775 [Promethearchaeota archaeon]|jgi:hypothetical protein
MCEESDQVEKIQIQTKQKTCSCGCKGQENVDFEKIREKLLPSESNQ